MPATPPYKIKHIPLQEQQSMPVPEVRGQGNYLVFWWNHIALGHLFIEPEEEISKEEYINKVEATLQPIVQFYTSQNSAPHKMPGLQDPEVWRRWMEEAFAALQPQSIPDHVPVSVVICTRNRASQLHRCLQELQQSVCLPAEIIVVDNAPRDDSTFRTVRQMAGVRYVQEPRPGLDIARNTGVQEASFPVVAFIDDDVAVHPLWVSQVWKAFEQPEVAAMTGLVLPSQLETEAQLIFEKHWSFNRGYRDIFYGPAFFKETLAQGPPVWRIGAGANMAFRKSIFEEAGYFNELLDAGAAGCNGDSEMWYRILACGGTIHYNPRAVVHHEHRKDMAGLKNQVYNYMRGHAVAALIQQRQHPQAGYKKHLRNIFLINYSRAFVKGFPAYRFQYRTLWHQVMGVFSGLLYYYRNKKTEQPTVAKPYASSAR